MTRDFLLFPQLFTPQQCVDLIALAQTVAPDDKNGYMTWQGEMPTLPEVRSSRLRWLTRTDPRFAFAFDKMDYALDDGDSEWGYETKKYPFDAIQFTEYHAERQGHYTPHVDHFSRKFDRQLSMTVQLSDPADYEGGLLELQVTSPPPADALMQRGTAVVFPSGTRHGVTRTVRGTRYSAVAWRQGWNQSVELERALVLQDFRHHAEAMRQRYDTFFADGGQHGQQHQILDYFFVRDTYAYLRTSADRILGQDLVGAFVEALRQHAEQRWGFRTVTWPYLSIYLNGMGQKSHNDACNGIYAYVLSLTHWDRRKFSGGETMVGRMGVFDALEPRVPRAMTNYFEAFPLHFGQTLLFDDRLPHCVPTVLGATDPLEARVALTGHISQ